MGRPQGEQPPVRWPLQLKHYARSRALDLKGVSGFAAPAGSDRQNTEREHRPTRPVALQTCNHGRVRLCCRCTTVMLASQEGD